MTQIAKTLAFTAMGGLVAGLAACGGGQTEPAAGGTATPGPETQGTDTASAAGAKDCECKAKNACQGKGACKGDHNECAGKNPCKDKGGCKAADCAPAEAAPAPAPATT